MYRGPWKVLGIEPTQDERAIFSAYARKLRECRPDVDPAGFQALVAARDLALRWHWPREAVIAPETDLIEQLDTAQSLEAAAEPADAPILDLKVGVRIAAPEKDPIAEAQQQAFAAISDNIRQLFETDGGESRKAEDVFYDMPRWHALFADLGSLSILQRRMLRDTVVRRVIPALPEGAAAQNIQTDVLQARGPVTVVGLLEEEFRLSQHQSNLVGLCGAKAAQRYFHWLDSFNVLHAIEKRRQAGSVAYRDENGIAIIPSEDMGIKIWPYPTARTDSQIKSSLLRARRDGRWPLEFVARAFLFPTSELILAGLIGTAFGVALAELLTVICMIASSEISDPNWTIFALSTMAALALRASAAIFIRRWAVAGAMSRIRQADRDRLTGTRRSDYIAAKDEIYKSLAWFANLFEMALTFCLAYGVFGSQNLNGATTSDSYGALRTFAFFTFIGLRIFYRFRKK